ncbi:MAG: hypothetical protein KDC15_03920 [Chitinophagaceae bacterium]|nr:hypothetical protein [Chitinophagaceae bacterium]
MTALNKIPVVKKWLFTLLIILLVGAAIVWYLFTLKHDDTATVKAQFTVEAVPFLKEFENDMNLANKKYADKMIAVNGTIAEIEMADTTANIKMSDTTNGAYIIFAFQQQHLPDAKTLKVGDKVSIKGVCSNGAFSSILETNYVTFNRCAINK